MFNKLFALPLMICCTSFALAGGYGDYEVVPYVRPARDLAYDLDQYEAENHTVFDLLVVVDEGDWLHATTALAYTWCVSDPNTPCATFWDHPMGENVQPLPVWPDYFGLVQYDTFYTCPEEYPNPDLDPNRSATMFAPGSPLQTGPYVYDCEWSPDPTDPNPPGGTYTLARFNILIDCDLCASPGGECYDYEPSPGAPVCAYFTMKGENYFASCGGMPWPFRIDIPICWSNCPGDVDGDGDTDLSDLATLLGAYGTTAGDPDYEPAADFDDDGDVDLTDLASLLGDYGCGA